MSKEPRIKTGSAAQETDEALMQRAAKGDREAFGAVVVRHQATVLSFVHRFIGLSQDAEDLCSEVFLRIWRSKATYAPTARFTTFLYRTTLNLCLNHIRSRKLRKTVRLEPRHDDESHQSDLPDRKSPAPDETLDAAERARLVREAVDELPENQRTAVLLLRWEEMSYNEIAETMDLSIMAVKSLLSRAKENLREMLLQRLDVDGAGQGCDK